VDLRALGELLERDCFLAESIGALRLCGARLANELTHMQV
jgi:hypothetical protein